MGEFSLRPISPLGPTGVVLSGATNPTLLANTAPLWVGLGTLIFFRKRLGSGFWIGTVIALLGAGLVLGLERDGQTIGLLLGLLAAVFYAGYFLVTQLGREKLDSLNFFWLAAMSSAAVLLVFNWGLGQPLTGYPSSTYLAFVAMAVITQNLGYFSIIFALGHLPASIVAPSLLGQPVITAILAGFLLGEAFSSSQILGGWQCWQAFLWWFGVREGPLSKVGHAKSGADSSLVRKSEPFAES